MTDVAVRASAAAVSAVLPPDFSAVQDARELVHSVLADWRAEGICDDVALVVSELVANALLHGLRLPAEGGELSAGHAGTVEVQLVTTGSHLICTVRDPSPLPPVRRPADEVDLGGRGLQLIESLSLCWGWTPVNGAKAVWAIFALDPRQTRDSGRGHQPAVSLRAS